MLQVCLCQCHLAAREEGPPTGVDPLAVVVDEEGFKPTGDFKPTVGTCPRCGWPESKIAPAPHEKAQETQAIHSTAAERKRKWRSDPINFHSELDRKARKMARLKEDGLCVSCGKEHSIQGATRCISCLAKRRAYYYQTRYGKPPLATPIEGGDV